MESIVEGKIFDYFENERLKNKITEEYPFVTHHIIGKSVCERDIHAFSLGNYKNTILFAGGFHGQEWMTCLVLYKFLERICNCLKNGKKLSGVDIATSFLSKGVTIIPCINPDGTEIAIKGKKGALFYETYVDSIAKGDYSKWNANAKGVDINHNFNAGWEELHKMETDKGIFGPSPRQYGGFAPESEPETIALVKFCEHNNVDHAFALHSQGEEIYWSYGENTPEQSLTMANIFSVCSGYSLVKNESLASHGGFKDWFIEYFHKSAFTIEIGKGENPLPIEDFEDIYEKIEEMLVLGAII